jgi:CBS domain-containing protein/NAD-dependent dihydropyrimidine dehydrogenase PreA subunit
MGSMMGSGGMVVMDEDTCMVDVARYFLSFTQAESCGKCPPCRIGTFQMLQILEKISTGKGEPGDIRRLVELARFVQDGSLCGLGQSAPNPVLSAIKYFRDEFREHVYDKFCRANVCSGTGVFAIDYNRCFRCGFCEDVCAVGAVKVTKNGYFIEQEECTKCKACYHVCPVGAVKIWKKRHFELKEEMKLPPESLDIIERRVRMKLMDILESKPSEVFTVSEKTLISDAVKLMDEKNIGAVLVLDNEEKLAGIFTERDLVHNVARHVAFETQPISKVMSRTLVTFEASMEISAAMSLIAEKKMRHLPIVEGQTVVGIITYRDFVSYLLPEVVFMAEGIY